MSKVIQLSRVTFLNKGKYRKYVALARAEYKRIQNSELIYIGDKRRNAEVRKNIK